MTKAVELFLDSGAYSVWRSGVSIDVDEYIAFIKKNEHLIEVYANLDVLPGRHGDSVSVLRPAAVEASASASFSNFERMHAAGLNPVGVLHRGEAFVWLDRMMEMGCDYVGIGTLSGGPSNETRNEYFYRVFDYLCNSDGSPKVKIHAFGITSLNTLYKFPFYSVDSTTWMKASFYGWIYVPAHLDGAFDYTRPPNVVSISNKPPASVMRAVTHYSQLSYAAQAVCKLFIEEAGIATFEEVCEDQYARMFINTYFWKQVGLNYEPSPFKRTGLRGLFA